MLRGGDGHVQNRNAHKEMKVEEINWGGGGCAGKQARCGLGAGEFTVKDDGRNGVSKVTGIDRSAWFQRYIKGKLLSVALMCVPRQLRSSCASRLYISYVCVIFDFTPSGDQLNLFVPPPPGCQLGQHR